MDVNELKEQYEVRWMRRYKSSENEIMLIKAKFHLHQIGNQAPYFSLTANIRYWGGCEAGGCCHEEIAEHFPEMAKFIPLHSSTEDGVPVHAVANGAYHLGCGKWGKRDPKVLKSHLRTTDEETTALLERCKESYDAKTGECYVQALINETLAERWTNEAKIAIEWLREHSND